MDRTRGTGALGLDGTATAELVALTGRVPSAAGGPAWGWRPHPDRIELHAEPGRPAGTGPGGRELRMGCGGALLVLRLGLTGRGVRPLVTRFPDPGEPGLVAVVRHGGTVRATAEQQRLLAAACAERPRRCPDGARPVSRSSRFALRRAAADEGAWLQPLTGQAGGCGTATGPAGPGPLTAVLTVHGDGPREELRAGEALQRVLLAAAAEGLAVSVVSARSEVAGLRGRAGGGRRPRVVLRLGRGTPGPAASGPAPGRAAGRAGR